MDDFAADSVNQIDKEVGHMPFSLLAHCCKGKQIRVEVLIDDILTREGSWSKMKVVNS